MRRNITWALLIGVNILLFWLEVIYFARLPLSDFLWMLAIEASVVLSPFVFRIRDYSRFESVELIFANNSSTSLALAELVNGHRVYRTQKRGLLVKRFALTNRTIAREQIIDAAESNEELGAEFARAVVTAFPGFDKGQGVLQVRRHPRTYRTLGYEEGELLIEVTAEQVAQQLN